MRVDGGASRISAAAGWVRAALEGVGDPGDWFPSDLFAEPCPYEPVGPFAASDRRLYLDAVRWAVREQAQRRGFAARFDLRRFWSPPARAVYFADLLDAMVGGNGLEGFLHQAPVEDVMGGLEALVALGCARLCQRYREGLTVAAREGGEFVYSVDERWLARERAPTAPAGARPWWVIDSWDEGGSYWLLKHELAPSLDAFVERHGAALLRSA